MGVAFHAKFVNKCANGHSINEGDYIAYDDSNNILCMKCPEFENRHKDKGLVYSNSFCPKCNLERSMSGACDCD